MQKITIYLKSGQTIRFKCENMTWQLNGNQITSYTIEKPNPVIKYIHIDSIDAIVVD